MSSILATNETIKQIEQGKATNKSSPRKEWTLRYDSPITIIKKDAKKSMVRKQRSLDMMKKTAKPRLS